MRARRIGEEEMPPERETPDTDCSGPGVILKSADALSWARHLFKPDLHHLVDRWWVSLIVTRCEC